MSEREPERGTAPFPRTSHLSRGDGRDGTRPIPPRAGGRPAEDEHRREGDAEDELDRLQGVIELIDGLLQVYQCHNKLLYRLFGSGAHAHDAGAHSSVGQSACLTRRRSSVRDRLCPPR